MKKQYRSTSNEYVSWRTMIQKCTLVKSDTHGIYLKKGIKVCKRWMTYENFLADMGKRPEGMRLDRINKKKGFSPANCRWATWADQIRNRTDALYVRHNGKKVLLSDLCNTLNLNYYTISKRLRKGVKPPLLLKKPCILRSVVQIDKTTNKIIKEYSSVRAAAKQIKGNSSSIYCAITGQSHSSAGYKWRYKKDK